MQLGIGQTNELINSFTQQVISDANGNPELIRFAFNYYGTFLDMGVGRGVPLSEVQGSNRRPKPWKNKVFAREIAIMAALLAEHFGRKATIFIRDGVVGDSL